MTWHHRRSSESRAPQPQAERFEQIPRNSRTRCNTDRRDRDGAVDVGLVAVSCGRRALAMKKLAVDESAFAEMLNRWAGRDARKQDVGSERDCFAFEAPCTAFGGALGFGLAISKPCHSTIQRSGFARAPGPRQSRRLTRKLKRAFSGGARRADHCKMVAMPGRWRRGCLSGPNRERESLVASKAGSSKDEGALARLGIRGVNPKLTRPSNVDGLRSPKASDPAQYVGSATQA